MKNTPKNMAMNLGDNRHYFSHYRLYAVLTC